MKNIVFFPAIENMQDLSDLVSRASWHLSILDDYEFVFYLKSVSLSIDDVEAPSSFSPEVVARLEAFRSRVTLKKTDSLYNKDMLSGASVILKWKEKDEGLNRFLKEGFSGKIYRVDSEVVRQEGSFYIQCAFDLLSKKDKLVSECNAKFQKLHQDLGEYSESWVLATGPSVEKYVEHTFDGKLVIACNSTILNDDLMKVCNPRIVVFADPIFHFGVSKYAGEFRAVVRKRLATTDINIILPFKYYGLFISLFPEYSDRIIGVPLDANIDFNSNIKNDFVVRSTANILTLLLLPVASTFSKSINILGCDGRPFDEDDYFWGHGKSVQINSQMENIQIVHPGFFKIDYNEYYYEHCHTLECLMLKGEEEGKRYKHHAKSHIPALRDRSGLHSQDRSLTKKHIIILEPDGVGKSGHYVEWHNQLIESLKEETQNISILLNKKQDASLYSCKGYNLFTSHSWGISRGDWCYKRGFDEHQSFVRFFEELEGAVLNYCESNNLRSIEIFMYYGSVQILHGFNKLRAKVKKLGIDIRLSLCLFHESVILNSKVISPRFPPNTKEVLMESLALSDSYSIATVTEALQKLVYQKFGTLTDVMPNPIPSGESSLLPSTTKKVISNDVFNVVFPCAIRPEKGGELVQKFIKDVDRSTIDTDGFNYYVRGFEDSETIKAGNVSLIADNLSTKEYEELLEKADLIVIPYLAPHFKYRTSGIIVDAMRMKKPIVTISDTWLADTVEKCFAGLTVKYLSSFSFQSAFKISKKNHNLLSHYSQDSFDRYRVQNSWENLVSTMFKLDQGRA